MDGCGVGRCLGTGMAVGEGTCVSTGVGDDIGSCVGVGVGVGVGAGVGVDGDMCDGGVVILTLVPVLLWVMILTDAYVGVCRSVCC